MTRLLLFVCACCVALVSMAPLAAATAPDSGTSEGSTTTVQVASGAPVPQSPPPRVGPFRGVASESGVRAAWWLLVVGGAQVVALMFITRRARARVPLSDDRP
jgi:hypothetical protein